MKRSISLPIGLIACFLSTALCLVFPACRPMNSATSAPAVAKNPLDQILKTPGLDTLIRPEYEIQIIYTQIDRDAQQRPHFTTWTFQADSNQYFYPASMVKMPLALLALEKINGLRQYAHPRFDKYTPYRMDSLRPFQRPNVRDTTNPGGLPSIAHDARQIFVVSDNPSYNHLFDFLGREYQNTVLRQKGYTSTGIMRRFYAGARDNSYSSPMTFLEKDGTTMWRQEELHDVQTWPNKQRGLKKGKGYINGKDSLVREPFDFSNQNWFSLTDMEKMIRAVMFPEAVPARQRFNLTPDDYRFVRHYMGIFPRECDHPRYSDPKEYYDGYCKFFLYGDTQAQQSGRVRVFNKVGFAYGTLTDAAYIADFDNKVEFIVAATILCNRDEVFNDDKYEFDAVGFPFFGQLGRAIHAYEIKRPRKVKPDLSVFEEAVR